MKRAEKILLLQVGSFGKEDVLLGDEFHPGIGPSVILIDEKNFQESRISD